MLKSSISKRLTLYSLILVILPLLICSIYMVDYFYKINITDKTNSLKNQAKTIADISHDYFNNTTNDFSLLKSISDDTGLRITLVNNRGTVIYDSSHDNTSMDNHSQRPEILDALKIGTGSSIRFSKTLQKNLLYVAVPVYDNKILLGVSRTAISITPLENSYDNMRNNILFIFLAVTIISIIIGIILTRHFTNPIKQMTLDAQKIINGDLSTRMKINTSDELEFLAAIINKLTVRLLNKINYAQTKARTLSLILDNMDNAVILLNDKGIITQTNRQAKKIFKITPDIMQTYSINCIGSTVISETAKNSAQENKNKKITLRIKLGNTEKTFIVFFAPFTTENKQSIVCVFHDISLLQEITNRQNIFVANAAHELSTPLTSIKGFSETLLDSNLKDTDTAHHFIQIIYDESCRMQYLVKNLLQLAKLNNEDYRKQLVTNNIDCSKVLTKVTKAVMPLFTEKNQLFKTNFSSEKIYIKANSDLFKQIFINLIENAIKYTPEKGTIELSYEADTANVTFTLSDNGIGIDKADLPFIFDRFYRSDKSRLRQSIGGSGIGLSLVKFLVELFGGKIFVHSILGKGTTFTLVFPRQQK
ncbi:ATP-binding protein [Pectinatus sottacetonis]|uniref:ATP-binding protein n=1 Tax=Pectinatus sottacetonis TaxID=1002795 RepID=UPI0018C7A3A4|nr:ATP-binding protein [Pectinatus sottacetonis]